MLEAIPIRLEAIASRLEVIATRVGARTLLGAPGIATRSKDATRVEAIAKLRRWFGFGR